MTEASRIDNRYLKKRPFGVISIANQKGGVGKTTTAVHLADGLSRVGKRVLLIDMDPQGNATSIFFDSSEPSVEKTSYAIFKDKIDVAQVCTKTRNEYLDLIPSVFQLTEVETLLAGEEEGFFRLREALFSLEGYEYIIIDCPPGLGTLTVNAMVAASHLIIPLQTSRFSIDGIQGMVDACRTIQRKFNSDLSIFGALLTMFNPRTNISQAILNSLNDYIPVFSTRISRSVAVEEAYLLKNTIFEYQPAGKVSVEYRQFTEEVQYGIEKR